MFGKQRLVDSAKYLGARVSWKTIISLCFVFRTHNETFVFDNDTIHCGQVEIIITSINNGN